MEKFDCVVVGGGMVGSASALTLANMGLTVAIIEKHTPAAFETSQPFDLRVSAISLASQYLLEQLDAWQQILDWRVCPYRRLAVWELEQSYTEFTSQEVDQTHLGHIIENRVIQLSLWQKIQENHNITLMCPEKLSSFEQCDDHVIVHLSNESIETKLLIAADGAHSQVRELAKIGTTGWDYQQSAMLINVETAQSQQDITWQHFRETGPVAFLPMPGNNASLVWYHKKEEINRLSRLPNSQLQALIHQEFPDKLSEIKVIDKASFPLTRRHANQYIKNRVMLLGDAAHTINPMAGQGVNLGFKDVKALQLVISQAIGEGKCWHDVNTLAEYEKLRRKDNLLMMSTMDLLYSGFSHPSGIAKLIRNGGLFMANKLPQLKSKALAYACGI